jgi:hypothetical protein
MPSIFQMTPDELQVARDAAETLIRFRAYLPPDAMLIMLAGRFRNDIRDVPGMGTEGRAHRGRESRSLDELTSIELDTVSGSVDMLLERFTPFMHGPELIRLLNALRDSLNAQKTERARLRASIGAS